jgi:hypothetical protein
MPILIVTYKGNFLVFPISQDDLDGTLDDIRKEPNIITEDKMIKELDCIESEINKYKKAYRIKGQTIMLEYISNKMLKTYNEIISTWINNVIKLVMMEYLITNEQNNYFTFEDNDELTILYRALLFDNNAL